MGIFDISLRIYQSSVGQVGLKLTPKQWNIMSCTIKKKRTCLVGGEVLVYFDFFFNLFLFFLVQWERKEECYGVFLYGAFVAIVGEFGTNKCCRRVKANSCSWTAMKQYCWPDILGSVRQGFRHPWTKLSSSWQKWMKRAEKEAVGISGYFGVVVAELH